MFAQWMYLRFVVATIRQWLMSFVLFALDNSVHMLPEQMQSKCDDGFCYLVPSINWLVNIKISVCIYAKRNSGKVISQAQQRCDFFNIQCHMQRADNNTITNVY